MRTKGLYILLLSFILSILAINNVLACEICTVSRLGRQEEMLKTKEDKKWHFEFLFEQQNWNDWPELDAHELHEDGRDVHNKTTENFYHFSIGRMLTENIGLRFEIPYIVRNSLGVEDGKVGNKDKSKGMGDLNTMLNYHLLKEDNFAVSAVGGIKFPTGPTNEKDSEGDRFEPELQPGSGSYDYILGGIFEYHKDRIIVKGNATYSFKTEGDQNFEFGDLFSTALFVDYLINPDGEKFKTKFGVDINYQLAQKDVQSGIKDRDSGGNTLFVGPAITIEGPKNTSIFGNFLYPVYQDLGGVHQEMNFVWTAGGKIKW